MLKHHSLLLGLICLLYGCGEKLSDQERSILREPISAQVERAKGLPLDVRYHLYLYQYDSAYPRDPRFAEAIAVDGRQAAQLLLNDMREHGYRRIASGMPILFAMRDGGYFDPCSHTDYMATLARLIRTHAADSAQEKALAEHVQALCERI